MPPLLVPNLLDQTEMIKQANSTVGGREKRKYEIQTNSMQNSDVEEQDESHRFSEHNSICLLDKNNEPIQVSKSVDFERPGDNSLAERNLLDP